MALDPTAPIRLGFRIGIAVVRFELRVLSHLLGRDDGHEPVVADAPPPVDVPIRRRRPDAPRSDPSADAARSEPSADAPRSQPFRADPVAGFDAEPAPVHAAPADDPAPLDGEPTHLDTEPELVAEFAEPGAEDGAGAEIRVEEPWPGYRKMRVAEVRERVAVANAAELAVVQLYEAGHRNRRSVLDAVERRSKELANAPGA